MTRRAVVLIVLAMLLVPVLALAEERFPPPEFSFDYEFPHVGTPTPRAAAFEWVDLVVLVLALGAAAWLALRKKSRQYLFLLAIFSLLYFGFYRQGCICPIGAIQNVALALGPAEYVLPISVGLFFLLPLLFALAFGRVFCASVCPLGALQEVTLLRPLRVPMWLERGLGVIPFVFLGAAALFAWTDTGFLICRYDPYVAFFRFGGLTHMLIAGGVMLLIGVFIGRPYCRFLCPLGALFRITAPLSAWHVRLGGEDCINCHLCANACPYNAIRPPTDIEHSRPPRTGRWTLGIIILSFPVLIVLGAWLGSAGSGWLAAMNPTVQRAARVFQEQQGLVEGTTEQSEAFYAQGVEAGGLYREAAEITRRFERGSMVLGGFLGVVVAWQLIAVSLRRTRDKYEIDPAACVSCGRCFSSCPIVARQKAGKPIKPTRDEQ
ncbi:MAG: 4Fe-4S binding protein [candidate division WS1 bacterium]|jgi:polyferredoxin|nr:4Fe-4S binding protein [candidate division WS1 bacterium]